MRIFSFFKDYLLYALDSAALPSHHLRTSPHIIHHARRLPQVIRIARNFSAVLRRGHQLDGYNFRRNSHHQIGREHLMPVFRLEKWQAFPP